MPPAARIEGVNFQLPNGGGRDLGWSSVRRPEDRRVARRARSSTQPGWMLGCIDLLARPQLKSSGIPLDHPTSNANVDASSGPQHLGTMSTTMSTAMTRWLWDHLQEWVGRGC